ncbi:MAG: glutamine-synthetase adenylyltransferase, partial [Pseudomonadota bacterium]
SGLPAGVQVFSLFTANLQLLSLIVEICAAAPRLAAYLGRRAQVLDALLDRDFWEPLAGEAALHSDLQDRLKQGQDYEARLDIARRWARELWFRTGVQVLRGIADAAEAGRAFTAIATASIGALLPEVTANFAERHGPPPGHDLAVLALGKLGSAEMTAGSDLDLIIIYDAEGAEESDGPKPLAASVYYPRLTQALIAALTAPTAEGAMYEVDMRLRPSGRQGPVAVSLRSFQKYQTEEAWVWEHMALSRARVIAGPDALQDRIRKVRTGALAARKGSEAVMSEAREMRGRLIEANARSRSDNWSLKHAAGGLMEIEFLTQTGALCFGLSQTRAAAEALPALTENRWLSEEDAASLDDALTLQSTLQQIERVALDAPLDPETIGPALSAVMVRAAGCADFPELSDRLASVQSTAAEIVQRIYADD